MKARRKILNFKAQILIFSKKYGNYLNYLVYLAFAISIIFNIYFLLDRLARVEVTRVVDGDSFELKDGRRIRLLGLDAPELENCMGPEAKDALKVLIEGKKIRLKNETRDDYGRVLANVFTGHVLVNDEMVKRGLSRFIYVSSPYYNKLKNAQDQAKAQGLGIFSPLCRNDISRTDCIIKGNLKEGKKLYHLPGCFNYKEVIIDESYGDRWFCSEEEAIASGFTKTQACPN